MTAHRTDFSPDFTLPHNAKFVSVLSTPGVYRNRVKRVIDVALVLMAAPFVVPVVALLALAVFLRVGGNPFYTQKRVGRHGETFTMWKLSSMVKNADELLEGYLDRNPEARKEWNEKQKLCNDPRITGIGAVLRKTSLDELPQLWNVLRGDMSLVGPRPMMPSQCALYPGFAYYALRPGLTGFWQISDRNQTSFAARAEFDSHYYETVSFKTDVSVLAATVGVVIRGTGC
ncbi:sugar transferase [Actibacterium sp. XHP0104]|uniref:sugar transferase n=1 Tax=Actibacterium sp. XHP0104 TaxID=2984335 RepID=UPI0021E8E643|nr:sugar transferase [Actibacterium sp. XHP0104]MCV2881841.1 sugar transferase [Actibacterium sp. XHP0104]